MGGAYRGVKLGFQLHSRERKRDGMDLTTPTSCLSSTSLSSNSTPPHRETDTHGEAHVKPHDNTV